MESVLIAAQNIFAVQRHINLHGLFNAEAILVQEQPWYDLTHGWGDKGVQTFPSDVSPKVNIIEWKDFESAYFVAAVQHVNHHTSELPSHKIIP